MNTRENMESRIELIEKMINSTKSDLSKNSFPFLLWGWLVFAASLLHYALMFLTQYKHPYIAWLLMVIGGIIHFIYVFRQEKKSKSKSFTDQALRGIWVSFSISIALLLLGMYAQSPEIVYPYFIILYAIAIFATGYVLEFKPLVYGALSNWIIAGFCLFQPFQFQLLLLALAILLSYIIPGYMLKAKYGK